MDNKCYYRVKTKWPAPHFIESMLTDVQRGTVWVTDSRFYTTATDLRDVYLDIQRHMAEYYSPKGFNMDDDQEDGSENPLSLLEPEAVISCYSEVSFPEIISIDVISDPQQVSSIDIALEYIAVFKNLVRLSPIGLLLSPFPWPTQSKVFHEHLVRLEQAVKHVLQCHTDPDEYFEELEDATVACSELHRDISEYVRELRGKLDVSQ